MVSNTITNWMLPLKKNAFLSHRLMRVLNCTYSRFKTTTSHTMAAAEAVFRRRQSRTVDTLSTVKKSKGVKSGHRQIITRQIYKLLSLSRFDPFTLNIV